jgi:uncharacterized protein (TIGR03435 family)
MVFSARYYNALVRTITPAAGATRKRGILVRAPLATIGVLGVLTTVWTASAQRPEFEVGSVKNSTTGDSEFVPHRSGDRVSIHMTHIFSVIVYAYHINGGYQLVGPPNSDYNWYDIDAKIGRDATDDEVRLMFQSLLEDRFKLKAHRETREIAQYELTIAKGKPRLTASGSGPMHITIEGRHIDAQPGRCGMSSWLEGAHLICHSAPMDQIATAIGSEVRAPVADRTGLTGTYDIDLLFIPENRKPRPDDPPGPSLADALQTDLGLKLQKGKGPVEVLVIDHMEKPSEN